MGLGAAELATDEGVDGVGGGDDPDGPGAAALGVVEGDVSLDCPGAVVRASEVAGFAGEASAEDGALEVGAGASEGSGLRLGLGLRVGFGVGFGVADDDGAGVGEGSAMTSAHPRAG